MIQLSLLILLTSLISHALSAKLQDRRVEDVLMMMKSKYQDLDKKMLSNGSLYNKETIEEVASYFLTIKTIKGWFEENTSIVPPIDSSKFTCSLEPSATLPSSVHKLRPADIEVIGAMGDSLTAGNGMLSNWIWLLFREYRGHVFSIGGVEDMAHQMTLPNILKKGNKNLYGYSTGRGRLNAGFNLAMPSSKAIDMKDQARQLVDRMKNSNNIDFNNDWKIVTIFVGGNDLCDFCKDRNKFSVINYKRNLMEALDILHAELPRTFVNLLEVLDVSLVSELKRRNLICRFLLGVWFCPCASDGNREFLEFQRGYQNAVREIAESGRYDTKEDFTVVSQPFFRNSAPPRRYNGNFDMSLFGPDCFHFSKLGQSYAGKSLWNNMLQKVGEKASKWSLDNTFECPTKERPFFATSKNSFI